MRITSNILGELGAAIKRAIVGPHETEIDVVPSITPVGILRGVLRNFNGSSVSGLNTFLNTSSANVTNGAAATTQIATLDPGMWELDIVCCYSSNYPTNPTIGGVLTFTQNAGVLSSNLMNLFCVAAAGGNIVGQAHVTLEVDQSTVIQVTVGNNGVGQSHSLSCSVLASKLL